MGATRNLCASRIDRECRDLEGKAGRKKALDWLFSDLANAEIKPFSLERWDSKTRKEWICF